MKPSIVLPKTPAVEHVRRVLHTITKTDVVYPGEVMVQDITTELFTPNTFMGRWGADIIPAILGKYARFEYTGSITIEEYACEGTASNTDTITQLQKEICRYMANFQFCEDDLINIIFQQSYTQKLNALDLSSTEVFGIIRDYYIRKIANDIDKQLILGNVPESSIVTDCRGFIEQWAGDSGVTKLTNGTLTTSNIVAKMSAVLDAMPTETYENSDPRLRAQFGVDRKAFEVIKQYYAQTGSWNTTPNFLSNPTANPSNFTGFTEWLGHTVVLLNNLPDNTIFASTPENLMVVVDAEGAYSEFNITRMQDSDAHSKLVKGRVDFALGIDYRRPSHVVLAQES